LFSSHPHNFFFFLWLAFFFADPSWFVVVVAAAWWELGGSDPRATATVAVGGEERGDESELVCKFGVMDKM
jgi:hypothetical protein